MAHSENRPKYVEQCKVFYYHNANLENLSPYIISNPEKETFCSHDFMK